MILFLLFLKVEETNKVIIKYFLVQAFSSAGLIFAFFSLNILNFKFLELIFRRIFFIKIGAAPFHM